MHNMASCTPLTPSSKQCSFLSVPLEMATTVYPNLAAYWMAT